MGNCLPVFSWGWCNRCQELCCNPCACCLKTDPDKRFAIINKELMVRCYCPCEQCVMERDLYGFDNWHCCSSYQQLAQEEWRDPSEDLQTAPLFIQPQGHQDLDQEERYDQAEELITQPISIQKSGRSAFVDPSSDYNLLPCCRSGSSFGAENLNTERRSFQSDMTSSKSLSDITMDSMEAAHSTDTIFTLELESPSSLRPKAQSEVDVEVHSGNYLFKQLPSDAEDCDQELSSLGEDNEYNLLTAEAPSPSSLELADVQFPYRHPQSLPSEAFFRPIKSYRLPDRLDGTIGPVADISPIKVPSIKPIQGDNSEGSSPREQISSETSG